LQFNDGSPVPEALFSDTFNELRDQFGAVSWEPQVIVGSWRHEGVNYKDSLTRYFVDVADLDEHRQFFKAFKEKLKRRFQQIDIWITSHPVDVI
jgi:hypothetical protein